MALSGSRGGVDNNGGGDEGFDGFITEVNGDDFPLAAIVSFE
jgi:hypothetical protein